MPMISPLLLSLSFTIASTTRDEVHHFADLGDTDRTWIGEDFFANRLQDWRIRGGRLECAGGAAPAELEPVSGFLSAAPIGMRRGTLGSALRASRSVTARNARAFAMAGVRELAGVGSGGRTTKWVR